MSQILKHYPDSQRKPRHPRKSEATDGLEGDGEYRRLMGHRNRNEGLVASTFEEEVFSLLSPNPRLERSQLSLGMMPTTSAAFLKKVTLYLSNSQELLKIENERKN